MNDPNISMNKRIERQYEQTYRTSVKGDNQMKKSRTLPALLSLVLALAMMLSLSVMAFAASPA